MQPSKLYVTKQKISGDLRFRSCYVHISRTGIDEMRAHLRARARAGKSLRARAQPKRARPSMQ